VEPVDTPSPDVREDSESLVAVVVELAVDSDSDSVDVVVAAVADIVDDDPTEDWEFVAMVGVRATVLLSLRRQRESVVPPVLAVLVFVLVVVLAVEVDIGSAVVAMVLKLERQQQHSMPRK